MSLPFLALAPQQPRVFEVAYVPTLLTCYDCTDCSDATTDVTDHTDGDMEI